MSRNGCISFDQSIMNQNDQSEVMPCLLVIQIQIQAVCSFYLFFFDCKFLGNISLCVSASTKRKQFKKLYMSLEYLSGFSCRRTKKCLILQFNRFFFVKTAIFNCALCYVIMLNKQFQK